MVCEVLCVAYLCNTSRRLAKQAIIRAPELEVAQLLIHADELTSSAFLCLQEWSLRMAAQQPYKILGTWKPMPRSVKVVPVGLLL